VCIETNFMKELYFPKRVVAISGGNKPMCLGDAARGCSEANKNGQEVISATLIVERALEDLISYYCIDFEEKDKIRFFSDNILRSNWFSFGAKKTVYLSIVNKEKFVKGKRKSLLEKLLKRVMSYRNAFVHGDFVHKEDGTYINYFEGQKTEDLLDDRFWEEVQQIFDDIFEILEEVRVAYRGPAVEMKK
jgi:hypothetical protein